MTSHGQQQWYDMEQFDLEEALRLFCETTTRSFLWGMWNEHQRAKILEERVAKQRQIISDRDDRISELNNRVQAVERMAEDRLMRVKQLEELEEELEQRIHELETAYDEVDKASLGALEFEQGLACEQAETIRELESEYKASLENVKFWQDFGSEKADTITEQAETIRELDDLLRRNTADYGLQLSQLRTDYADRGKLIEMLHQNVADRDEDVRKLKIRIVQLEEDKERLQQHTLVISKKNTDLTTKVANLQRGVGQ
jgi:uncharacterized protein (DUF3084 family)